MRTEGRKRQPSATSVTGVEPRRARLRIRRHERIDPPESLDGVLRRHVQWVMARSRTFSEAAQRLGIDLTTLWRMRKRWRLD